MSENENNEALKGLGSELQAALQDSLKDLAEGAKADLKAYAGEMARDAAECLLLPAARRDAVLTELKAQVKVIAERNRVRAVNEGWELFERVTVASLRAGVQVGAAALAL